MGRLFLITLEGRQIYICRHCHTHLAIADDIVSKAFFCKRGQAYLINRLVNITLGEQEDRDMMTGVHTVMDTFCAGCGSSVGWKYVAHEKTQKYKEGKFILERHQVMGPREIEDMMNIQEIQHLSDDPDATDDTDD